MNGGALCNDVFPLGQTIPRAREEAVRGGRERKKNSAPLIFHGR
jgi:hypothetical protein